MQIEIAPGARLGFSAAELAIEWLVDRGFHDIADKLIALLDAAYGDPDVEDHPLWGEHDGRELNGDENDGQAIWSSS